MREAHSKNVIDRTMYFDSVIVQAAAEGCKQFVLMAAGLDTRAWRLPFDDSHTVFEVDCEACFKYKELRAVYVGDGHTSMDLVAIMVFYCGSIT